MSRFGLRRRLKAWMGGAKAPRADVRHAVVLVLPDKTERTVDAEDRYTLVMASQVLDTPISTGCPDGGCGGCAVDVLASPPGALSSPTDAERRAFETGQGRELSGDARLACHARVTGPGNRIGVRAVWTLDDQRGE